MMIRSFLIAALLAAPGCAFAQSAPDGIATPMLRASVTVSGDLVRIGDVLDNPGPAAQIAIFRAPDLGTTGSVPVRQLLAALRAHQVIGVDTRDLQEIAVTRAARTLSSSDIERQVAQALERRGGLGDAANLSLTFDRDVQPMQLDAGRTGALSVESARFESRSGRFDVMLQIPNQTGQPTKLHFTGTAIETVEAVILARGVERNDIIKASDVMIERRPKADIGGDAATRDRTIGLQARRQLRAGQPLRNVDLAKPDLVLRNQSVTLIYDTAGLYLTVRGKAMEAGADGDVVNVLNLQSKRTVSGTVISRGQVAVTVAAPRRAAVAESAPASPVAFATAEPRKAE